MWGSKEHACALHSSHRAAACVFFEAMCVYEGCFDWQRKSGCRAVPVVEAGCGRRRVLSRQYEAYVRDQCVDCGDHWDEKDGRALGVERDRDYWGLDALTTGRMAAHHTHSHLSHSLLSPSQAEDTHARPSGGRMHSPMLIILSSSPGGSVRSFVSRIMTEGIRARLSNHFKLLSVCSQGKTEWWRLKSAKEMCRDNVQYGQPDCCPKQNAWPMSVRVKEPVQSLITHSPTQVSNCFGNYLLISSMFYVSVLLPEVLLSRRQEQSLPDAWIDIGGGLRFFLWLQKTICKSYNTRWPHIQ